MLFKAQNGLDIECAVGRVVAREDLAQALFSSD